MMIFQIIRRHACTVSTRGTHNDAPLYFAPSTYDSSYSTFFEDISLHLYRTHTEKIKRIPTSCILLYNFEPKLFWYDLGVSIPSYIGLIGIIYWSDWRVTCPWR